MVRRGDGRVWMMGLVIAAMLGSAGPAFGFGEVFQITGRGKIWHFEPGPFTPAPSTNVNATQAALFIAQNFDPDGKAYACWVNGTTLWIDVDPSFPAPQVFTGLLSSLGEFMVFTTQDGRAVMLSGQAPSNPATSSIVRMRGNAFVLSGPLQSPASFDHFSRAEFDTAKLVSTGGCGGDES